MSKEYLDKDRVKIEFHRLGHYTDQSCKEFLVHNVSELINQICKLQPKNQVVIAEGEYRGIIFNYNNIPSIMIKLENKDIKDENEPKLGKKVKIILEIANEKSRRSYKDVKLHILDSPNRKK